MCGRSGERVGDLLSAVIEGVPLTVCNNCAKYGTVNRSFSGRRDIAPEKYQIPIRTKPEFKVVDTFASLLRRAREKKGMTQKDFALSLQEKESFIGKWESGSSKPDLETAQKLQRLLKMTLIALDEEAIDTGKVEKRKNTEFTLGDFIKVKKR